MTVRIQILASRPGEGTTAIAEIIERALGDAGFGNVTLHTDDVRSDELSALAQKATLDRGGQIAIIDRVATLRTEVLFIPEDATSTEFHEHHYVNRDVYQLTGLRVIRDDKSTIADSGVIRSEYRDGRFRGLHGDLLQDIEWSVDEAGRIIVRDTDPTTRLEEAKRIELTFMSHPVR